jgi:hypothetical protein
MVPERRGASSRPGGIVLLSLVILAFVQCTSYAGMRLTCAEAPVSVFVFPCLVA